MRGVRPDHEWQRTRWESRVFAVNTAAVCMETVFADRSPVDTARGSSWRGESLQTQGWQILSQCQHAKDEFTDNTPTGWISVKSACSEKRKKEKKRKKLFVLWQTCVTSNHRDNPPEERWWSRSRGLKRLCRDEGDPNQARQWCIKSLTGNVLVKLQT